MTFAGIVEVLGGLGVLEESSARAIIWSAKSRTKSTVVTRSPTICASFWQAP